MQPIRYGVQRLFEGFRTGDTKIILTGFAALGFAALRRKPKRKLLHSQRIARGEEVVIKLKDRD